MLLLALSEKVKFYINYFSDTLGWYGGSASRPAPGGEWGTGSEDLEPRDDNMLPKNFRHHITIQSKILINFVVFPYLSDKHVFYR